MDENTEEILYKLAFGDKYTPKDKEIFDRFGRHFEKNEVIVKEGDKSAQLFLIVRGAVRIVKNIGTPEEKGIALLTEGEIFGEMSYFDDLPRSASVIAAIDSDLLVLDKEHYDMLFQMHPNWTTTIIEALAKRINLSYLNFKNNAFDIISF